ncbi:hypothetical protein [Parasediminibacterium sp. JCM 36343]|uniref:hypothetical protein n=1 Tax=Parasediminibacterium sp. JCM 36343 TaxID=3374279 RepID=UPI00397CE1B2
MKEKKVTNMLFPKSLRKAIPIALIISIVFSSLQSKAQLLNDIKKKAKEVQDAAKQVKSTVKEVTGTVSTPKETTNAKPTETKPQTTKPETNKSETKIYVPEMRKYNAPTTTRPLLSELKDEKDIIVTTVEPNTTKVEIAKNLILYIKGKYPTGYKPNWKCVWSPDNIVFKAENNVVKRPIFNTDNLKANIAAIENKAIVFFDGGISDIIIPNGVAIINEQPQTFKLDNFRNFKDGQPYRQKNPFFKGGWVGVITLSSKPNGDIIMSLKIDGYGDNRTKGRYLSYGWSVENYLLQNQTTPENAFADIKEKRDAKVRDSLNAIQMAKEAEAERIAFEKQIKNSYQDVMKVQNAAQYSFNFSCLKIENESYTTPGYSQSYQQEIIATNGNTLGYETKYRWKPGYSTIKEGYKNTCNNPIIIRGIKKLQSPSGTIYYEDASIQLESGKMTDGILKIEDYYNKATSEIGSTHYYKNKLGGTAIKK